MSVSMIQCQILRVCPVCNNLNRPVPTLLPAEDTLISLGAQE